MSERVNVCKRSVEVTPRPRASLFSARSARFFPRLFARFFLLVSGSLRTGVGVRFFLCVPIARLYLCTLYSIRVFIITSRRDTFRVGVLSSDDKTRRAVGESARGSGAAGGSHVHRSPNRCFSYDRAGSLLSRCVLWKRMSSLPVE